MEDRQKYLQLRSVFINIIFFVLTLFIVAISTFLYKRDWTQLIRNVVITCICMGTIFFLVAQSRLNHTFSDDNEEHPLRFYLSFFSCVLVSVLLPILPTTGWPYVVIFITLTLFSNLTIGITSATFLLMVSVLLGASADINTFCLYFVSGIVCSILFQKLDDDFKIGYPLLISIMVIFVSEIANAVLFINETLHMELLIIPMVNIVVSAILILVILKLYGHFVIFKYRERFMIINDSECPLLVELKEKQPDLYLHTVHVAYLSDKIATRINVDTAIVKTLAYYSKISSLAEEVSYENTMTLIEEYDFPMITYDYLKDVIENGHCPTTKEAFVVLVADMMITSIEFLYAKNPNKEIQYEQIVGTVIKKKIDGIFPQKCNITYGEVEKVKNVLLEEKLYYDFLHR